VNLREGPKLANPLLRHLSQDMLFESLLTLEAVCRAFEAFHRSTTGLHLNLCHDGSYKPLKLTRSVQPQSTLGWGAPLYVNYSRLKEAYFAQLS
jgi:hypothetical protein